MRVYLDHNATALPDAGAQAAAMAMLQTHSGNPSSVHGSGRTARAAIENARRVVAASIGAASNEIIFTSGATEAIHLAIASMVSSGGHVVCSSVEHPAVYGALEAIGAKVTLVPVDGNGSLTVQPFVDSVTVDTQLVVVMAAQNEIGNRYPVTAIAKAVQPVPVFCDAVQLYGKAPIDVAALGSTGIALSGHKVGAPAGVGALWLKRGHEIRPSFRGGPQERGRRAGTENTLGVTAFGAAAARIAVRVESMERLGRLRQRVEEQLQEQLQGLIIHGERMNRLANTLSFRIEGVPGDLVLQALDLEGFEISSGSACSSGGVEPSHTLLAMGLNAEQARGGLRVSLGPENTAAELDHFVETLVHIVARVRGSLTERGA